MVARFRSRQREQCGREKHCLVIGMGNQKADALIAKTGERSPYDLRGVQPCCRQDYGNGKSEIELHAVLLKIKICAMIGSQSCLSRKRPGRKQIMMTRGDAFCMYVIMYLHWRRALAIRTSYLSPTLNPALMFALLIQDLLNPTTT